MKKLTALALAAVMTLGFGVTAFASDIPASRFNEAQPGFWGGCCGGLMWDEDGNFLSRDAFIERLDGLIQQGFIPEGEREFFIEMYDWCAAEGGGQFGRGFRRGGRGFGQLFGA